MVRQTPNAVYPRVCGGTSVIMRSTRYERGLSPRVRGNHQPLDLSRIHVRSIPRVCGGTSRSLRTSACAHGLSPRVRGNQPGTLRSPVCGRSIPRVCGGTRHICGPQMAARSIPACAGEPCPARHRPGRSPVYPRVCGGTNVIRLTGWAEQGLSPRVRGNLVDSDDPLFDVRSIPACAGEPMQDGVASEGV